MRPLIGITSTPQTVDQDHGSFRRYCLSDTYTKAVERAGGIPVILPLHADDIDALLDRLDGIIFSGGGDIAAANWGDAQSDLADTPDEERDTFDITTMRHVIERDMPLLGICRGVQVLNVASGGSLYQDIGAEYNTQVNHRQHETGKMREETSDEIRTLGDSVLSEIVGSEALPINSFHHQALRDVAPNLKTVATSDDGIVEACVVPDMTFGLGLQFHPEMLAANHPRHQAIFDRLIKEATAYAERKRQK